MKITVEMEVCNYKQLEDDQFIRVWGVVGNSDVSVVLLARSPEAQQIMTYWPPPKKDGTKHLGRAIWHH